MSTESASLSRTRTQTDGANDPYDHAISLIDTTVPKGLESGPRTRSPSPSSAVLAKKQTKGSVREHLARRKYAKWQQDKYPSKEGSTQTEEGDGPEGPTKPKDDMLNPPQVGQVGEIPESDVADFAQQDEEAPRAREGKRHRKHKHPSEPSYEVDILYENQRGWFFFGIPLYSHSSLLNFDPSPWVTKDFKDSAVDITNAQVPDPSWMWSWKTWYVDMSYDVDEQGWQYSFSFGKGFSWHGTHPWFHSFVRRRRWLRKRVKKQESTGHEKDGSLSAAHQLTGDYFTIHPKRDRSPVSFADDAVNAARPSSYISIRTGTDVDEPPEDIKNIPNLLRALRSAKVDREKIDLVKKFIDQGGDELAYLAEKIPEIMTFLVFQNSRKQLLLFLKKTAEDAQQHRDEHDAEDKVEGAAESKRIDNILSAVQAADGEIRGLEYWSDRKHVLRTADDTNSRPQTVTNDSGLEDHPVDIIKGISDQAEIEIDHEWDMEITREKGKGKAVEQGDDDHQGQQKIEEEAPPPRLQHDSVLIPDENTAEGAH